MSKFLRIWRPVQQGKHKKLSEETLNHSAQRDKKAGRGHLQEDFGCDGYDEDEIVSFRVKYLGSTVVEKLGAEENLSEHAVKCILSSLKAPKKASKPPKGLPEAPAAKRKKPSGSVELTISPKGLCVMQAEQGVDLLKISIYRISNCRTYRQRIVSFLATDALETTECHAFLCKGRKSAEHVALAMARAFHAAYEQWTNVANIAPLRLEGVPSAALGPPLPSAAGADQISDLLITFDDEHDAPERDAGFFGNENGVAGCAFAGNAWVSFEDGQGADLLR